MRGYACAAVAALLWGGLAGADGLQIGGFWYDPAEVVGFEGGRVLYELAGATRDVAIGELQAVRVVGVEAVERGDALWAEGDAAGAAAAYAEAAGRVRRPWAQAYVNWRLTAAADAAGQARAATEAWLALVRADAEPLFYAAAPVNSLAAADAATKQWAGQQLDRLRRPPAAAAEGIEAMRAALAADAAAAATARVAAVEAAADTGESAVVLPSFVAAGDPVGDLLAAGDFAAAAERARAELATEGGLAKHLYLLGVAQLALAEQGGGEDVYLDAGLSFMRSAIYFPRGRYTGFALAEAGRVHAAIGRTEKAAELYRRAALLIDDQVEPAYAQRLAELREANGE